jgi:hypothetical protein
LDDSDAHVEILEAPYSQRQNNVELLFVAVRGQKNE